MGLINDFYTGELRPEERFGRSDDKKYLDLLHEYSEQESKFLFRLNGEDGETFEELKQKNLLLGSMELERMFCYAFRMGFLFSAEIFREELE